MGQQKSTCVGLFSSSLLPLSRSAQERPFIFLFFLDFILQAALLYGKVDHGSDSFIVCSA